MKIIRLLGFAVLAVILSACGRAAEVASPTETPIILPATPTPPLPDTATATPAPTTPGEASPTPSAEPGQYPAVIQLGDPLPDDRPWLLVEIDHNPYLISEDGEHVIEIDPSNRFSARAHLYFEPSPTGEIIAIIVSNDLAGVDLNLYLWSLVDNTVSHITSMLGNQDSSKMTEDEYSDIYISAGDVAWSHDGSKLAFTSAHLGATTDLYVYDLKTEEILWLTTGSTQAINPLWSLDDAYILHTGVTQLHIGYSGSGYSGWQYFSAAPDGSQVHSLSEGKVKVRGFEAYLGWVSNRQMLVHSGYDFCGWFDLRMMNIVSGEEYYMWHGSYNEIAYSPESGLALVFISPTFSTAEEFCGVREEEPGLYLVTIPDGQVTDVPLNEIDVEYVTIEIISGEQLFFLRVDKQWYTVDLDGNINEFDGNPHLPEQFWHLDIEIDYIYGWVSNVGLVKE